MPLAPESQSANDYWLQNVQIEHEKIHINYIKCRWKKLYILLWRVIDILTNMQSYSSFWSYEVVELFPDNT